MVSEISYGNWLTHGSQVEEDAGARVRARGPRRRHHHLRHRRRLRRHQGRVGARPRAARRAPRGPRDLHQGLLADRSRARTTAACRASTSSSRCNASLQRLQTDYVDLYQAHRFDVETPLEETMRAFDDLVRAGKVLYVGVSEWTAEQIARGAANRRRAGSGPHRVQPAAVQHALAGHRGARSCRLRQGRASARSSGRRIAQGVLTGKYRPGRAAARRAPAPPTRAAAAT